MLHIINPTTVLIDCRSDNRPATDQSEAVHKLANQHFFNNELGHVHDNGGTFLGGNTLHKYHVASVCYGIWLVSKLRLAAEQTRPVALTFLKDNPLPR